MDIAGCMILMEPFICFKLFKKHHEIIKDMNDQIEERLLEFSEFSPINEMDEIDDETVELEGIQIED